MFKHQEELVLEVVISLLSGVEIWVASGVENFLDRCEGELSAVAFQSIENLLNHVSSPWIELRNKIVHELGNREESGIAGVEHFEDVDNFLVEQLGSDVMQGLDELLGAQLAVGVVVVVLETAVEKYEAFWTFSCELLPQMLEDAESNM
jgi:hypothetical protein